MLNVRRAVSLFVRLLQGLTWILALLYVALRQRASLAFLVGLGLLTIALLLHWGLVCINMQTWRHVNRVCVDHLSGEAVGNLCAPLCINDDIESLACQAFHSGKEAVFSANWKNRDIIFKSPKRYDRKEIQSLYWWDDKEGKRYPNEQEFITMIKDNAFTKFNMTITESHARNLSRIIGTKSSYRSANSEPRYAEMRNVWFLLQDNEYLALHLYERYDIFPKLVGNCGSFFAVQRVPSIIQASHLFSIDDSKEDWDRRIQLAIFILDYLKLIERKVPEPLRICDVKLSHFGLADGDDKIKYLDLDAVHPLSVVNKLTSDGSECAENSDCDFFDCRSVCNKVIGKCIHPVANNNLQIVCEKVFLGWAVSGRVLVPGLLLGPHTPRILSDLLQRCANPENESGTPRSPTSEAIRLKLYDMLVKIND